MDKELSNEDVQKNVEKFLKQKNIENSFIVECVIEFVEGHTEMYGNIISLDDLMERLESNVDKITFAGKKGQKLGEYKGRENDEIDQNEILIYADLEDLEISETNKKMWNVYTKADQDKLIKERNEKREKIKSTLLYELIHASYTIKGKYEIGEKHIFSENGKKYYVEAVVNYISNRVAGNNKEQINTYRHETEAIFILADKIGEDAIIESAWNSDEERLEKAVINIVEKDGKTTEEAQKKYKIFDDYLKSLVLIREKNYEDLQYNEESNIIIEKIKEIFNYEEKKFEEEKVEEIKQEEKKEQNCTNEIKKEDSTYIPKNALEDVSSCEIRRSFLDKSIKYIKDIIDKTKNEK